MKKILLTVSILGLSFVSAQAAINNCTDARNAVSNACTEGKSVYSPDYWKCKTGAWVAFGICKVVESQVNAEVSKKLTDACSDPHSQACEEALDEVVNDAAAAFVKEPDFDKQQLFDEIAKDTTESK